MNYSINGRSPEAKRAFNAAEKASTTFGKATKWVRLARVLSFDDDRAQDKTTYVIACRKVFDGTKVQLACGCPDWIYRRQQQDQLCKHQVAFLTRAAISPFEAWRYRAGDAFLASMHGELAEGEERLMLQCAASLPKKKA